MGAKAFAGEGQCPMIELLVGVNVVDELMYTEYRARMTPLLELHGGAFAVDVRVAEVLRAPDGKAFNRLFTLRFPSVAQLDAFFGHPDYLAIRRRLFEPSVTDTIRFGKYQVLT